MERFGKFCKMIDIGIHYLIPFLDKIKAVYKIEYPLPDVEGYEVGVTMKLKLLKEHCQEEDVHVMATVKDVLERTIKECGPTQKLVEDKINITLAEVVPNMYTMELKMGYVKASSHSEAIERRKEKMIKEEKKEEKNKSVIRLGSSTSVVGEAVLASPYVPYCFG